MSASKPHQIQREGTAYEGDQPVTYEIKCSCGEVFDHIAPENARQQWREHAGGSNQHPKPDPVARLREIIDANMGQGWGLDAEHALDNLVEQLETLRRHDEAATQDAVFFRKQLVDTQEQLEAAYATAQNFNEQQFNANVRVTELQEQLEATRSALQALVDYADGKVGDDFGTTEWARAREVLNPAKEPRS